MAKCAYCGSTIILGGKRDGDLRFCNNECYGKAALIQLARQSPPSQVEEAVRSVYSGNCPK